MEITMTTILVILAMFVVLSVFAGVLYGLATRNQEDRMPATSTEAIVEVRSGTLAAFDFPSESVLYQLPQAEPGWYRLTLDAIKSVDAGDGLSHPEGIIDVDLGIIMLVDAQFEDALRLIEERLFEEINACPSVIYRYDAVVKELGITFGYLDVDDGHYILDVSRIERISDNDVKDLQQVASADAKNPRR
jgi:hypothetical protein